MNFLKREKIRRQIYKIEESKKKKEELEKLKYPALNGFINENNILDHFLFDKEEENEQNFYNSDNNVEIEYNINSYFNNEEIPDLYTPLGIISGNKYKLISIKGENEEKNNEQNKLLLIKSDIKENKEEENKNEKKNTKLFRYFNLDYVDNFKNVENLSKCKKCGKQSKCNCGNINFNCYICLNKEHEKKNCPLFYRCNICLNNGHISKDCPEMNDPKCENCKKAKHQKEDCIKHPTLLTRDEIQNNINIKCEFCGSGEHIICPYSQKEKYNIIFDYDYENDKKIEINPNEKDCSMKLDCPICGGEHFKKDCTEKKDNKTYSERSDIRSISDMNSMSNNNSNKKNNDDNWDNDNEINETKNIKNYSDTKINKINFLIDYKSFEDWEEKNDDNQFFTNEKKENNSFDNNTSNSTKSGNNCKYNDHKNNYHRCSYNHNNNYYNNYNKSQIYKNNYNNNSRSKNKNNYHKAKKYYNNYNDYNIYNKKNDDYTNYSSNCISLKEENNYEERKTSNYNGQKYNSSYNNNSYNNSYNSPYNNKYNNCSDQINLYKDYIMYKRKKSKY